MCVIVTHSPVFPHLKGGFDGEQNLSSVECFQRCENSSTRLTRRRHQHIRLTDDGDDDGRVSVVMVEDEEDEDDEEVIASGLVESQFTSGDRQLQAQALPSTSRGIAPTLVEFQNQDNEASTSSVFHHQRRRRGRSRSLRGGRHPFRHCKSRDDEDMEEWLEEGPRSLLSPRLTSGGLAFQHQTDVVTLVGEQSSIDANPQNPGGQIFGNYPMAMTSHSDEGSMDLPTVTTEVRGQCISIFSITTTDLYFCIYYDDINSFLS